MPFYVNVLLGVDAAYNHNAFVVWIALFFVFDQIIDHRFPIARPQLDPKSGPRLLELPEDSSALNVGKGFAEGSIPCNVVSNRVAWAASEDGMALGTLNKVRAISLKMSDILALFSN
jgi:hypothetical protein